MSFIDLHVHSTCSDGLLPPDQVVRKAAAEGVSLLAIADHDSISGVPSAIQTGASCGVTVLPAMELSVEYGSYHDVHLLGYGIDVADRHLTDLLTRFQKRRDTRGVRIVEKINEQLAREGRSTIDIAAVQAHAKGALGRPHIARELMTAGHVRDMEDAFTRYLEPCNVAKEYFPVAAAITEIHRTGGVAVLAHPQSISTSMKIIRTVIGELKLLGLDGIEAHNTMGTAEDAGILERYALGLDLLTTGGSDYHGFAADCRMGTIHGAPIPTRCGTELLARLRAIRPEG